MKDRKHWTIVAIIAFFNIIGFIACSYGNEDLEIPSINGIWNNINENMTVIITENSIFISKGNGSFELNITDSSMESNNIRNKNDFPSGIKLYGKVLSSTGSFATIYSVGNIIPILFFFNLEKNEMITDIDIDFDFVFIKEKCGYKQTLCLVYNCPICSPVKETEHQEIMCLVYNCQTCSPVQ
jgi:hypothetical protein